MRCEQKHSTEISSVVEDRCGKIIISGFALVDRVSITYSRCTPRMQLNQENLNNPTHKRMSIQHSLTGHVACIIFIFKNLNQIFDVIRLLDQDHSYNISKADAFLPDFFSGFQVPPKQIKFINGWLFLNHATYKS